MKSRITLVCSIISAVGIMSLCAYIVVVVLTEPKPYPIPKPIDPYEALFEERAYSEIIEKADEAIAQYGGRDRGALEARARALYRLGRWEESILAHERFGMFYPSERDWVEHYVIQARINITRGWRMPAADETQNKSLDDTGEEPPNRQ
jgi:hypothetical protein